MLLIRLLEIHLVGNSCPFSLFLSFLFLFSWESIVSEIMSLEGSEGSVSLRCVAQRFEGQYHTGIYLKDVLYSGCVGLGVA